MVHEASLGEAPPCLTLEEGLGCSESVLLGVSCYATLGKERTHFLAICRTAAPPQYSVEEEEPCATS